MIGERLILVKVKFGDVGTLDDVHSRLAPVWTDVAVADVTDDPDTAMLADTADWYPS